MPTVVLRRAPRSPALDSKLVRALGDDMLRALALEGAELSVLLTNDARIRELNREHRGKDRATDVLAFPLGESPEDTHRWLGDVVISLDTADRQARGRRRELLAEVRFLLAHGVLHLLGYDHDTPKKKARMTKKTRALVSAVTRGGRRSARRPAKRPTRKR